MTTILASRQDLESELEDAIGLLKRAYRLANIHGNDSDVLGVEARDLMKQISDLIGEVDLEWPE